MQAGLDKLAAQRKADRADAAQQREADRAHAAQQRKADRRWVTAAAVFIAVEVAAVEAGLAEPAHRPVHLNPATSAPTLG